MYITVLYTYRTWAASPGNRKSAHSNDSCQLRGPVHVHVQYRESSRRQTSETYCVNVSVGRVESPIGARKVVAQLRLPPRKKPSCVKFFCQSGRSRIPCLRSLYTCTFPKSVHFDPPVRCLPLSAAYPLARWPANSPEPSHPPTSRCSALLLLPLSA